MQKIGPCKIQTGNIRIIHPINLTDLEITINQLTNIVYQKEKNNHALNQIGKHKIRELYSNFLQIKPITIRELNGGTSSERRGNGSPATQTPKTYVSSTKV